MISNETALPFFVAGGTVPPGSPSYVERTADRDVLEALIDGEFCYVLNSRQMGKSSLAVRTIARLSDAGVKTAFVDLTRIGGATVTPDQWYSGLLLETGRALGLRTEAAEWLKSHRDIGPAQRFFSFLNELVLRQIDLPVVLMIDEIDAVRSLHFSTDELFAGLRQLHNGRASDPELRRLTVCLLGAALPSDLIRDPRTTPFNIGRRIELRDFTAQEARPFASQLGEEKLARLLYWTGGHPFLTQAIGADLAKGGDVDATVRSRYLDARARDTDTNLADVGRRLLGEGDPNVNDAARADVLSLYDAMLRGRAIADDEANAAAARIKMSGAARIENGELKTRNRIYERSFDRTWVRENMPGQERRRQRRAFWRGAIRTGLIATAVIGIVSVLAVLATKNAARASHAESLAKSERDAALYDTYVASMQTMIQKQTEGNGNAIRRTLADLKTNPTRGWEFNLWSHEVNDDVVRLDYQGVRVPFPGTAPESPYIALGDADAVFIYNVATGLLQAKVTLPHAESGAWNPSLFHNGRRVLAWSNNYDQAVLIDAATGKILKERKFDARVANLQFFDWDSPDDRFTLIRPRLGQFKGRLIRLDLATLDISPTKLSNDVDPQAIFFDRRNEYVAFLLQDNGRNILSIRRSQDLSEVHRISTEGTYCDVTFSPQTSSVAVADGKTVTIYDAPTGHIIVSMPYFRRLSGFQFSPNGSKLLISPVTRTAEEYDISTGQPRLNRNILDAYLTEYVADGKIFINGDDARLIQQDKRQIPNEVHLPSGTVDVAAESDRRVWFLYGPRVLSIDKANPLAPPILAADNNMIMDDHWRFGIRPARGKTTLYELDKKQPGVLLQHLIEPIKSFVISEPNGDRIAVLLERGGIAVYNAHDGSLINRLEGSHLTSAAFSPDGKWVAASDASAFVTVWDSVTGKKVASARLGRDEVTHIAFSDDSQRVAGAAWFGDLGILDIRTGATMKLLGAAQDLAALTWSHDGSRVAAGGSDQKVHLWDARTGRELGEIGTHSAPIIDLWFTSNDRTLCSADSQGTIKFWMTGDRL